MSWFTAEQLDEDTYAISEYGHWEETHCYLLLGRERALLIDTGLGVGDLREEVQKLTSLPLLVTLTHAHWDHIGGLAQFPGFAVQEAERPWLAERFPLPEAVVRANLLREPCTFPSGFDPGQYRAFQGAPSRILREGDRFSLGGREVEALHMPGHSPGHLCYWEPGRGTLYAGDLLYAGKLDAFYPTTDPAAFRRSVRRAAALPLRRILPGHHSLEVPVSLAEEVRQAFDRLEQEGRLVQGAGIREFGSFSIHL